MKFCDVDRLIDDMIASGKPPIEIFSFATYRTPEYQRCVEPFVEYAAAFERELRPYQNTYMHEFEQAKQSVLRMEYGKGSQYLPLGYYNPDPIADLVVTNIKRGRLLKRVTTRTKPDYTYGFDSEGKLRVVETFAPEISTERKKVLIHSNSKTICIHFNVNEHFPNGRLAAIYKMEYENGLLKKMHQALPLLNRISDLEIWEYEYDDLGIAERVHTSVALRPENNPTGVPPVIVYRSAIAFTHDENGLVSGFYDSTNYRRGVIPNPAITEIPLKDRRRV